MHNLTFKLFAVLLIFLFLYICFNLIYLTDTKEEKFAKCKNTPSGPYNTKCSLINFNDNVLTAYCADNTNDQKLVWTSLDMDQCGGNSGNNSNNSNDSEDCSDVSVGNDGGLFC